MGWKLGVLNGDLYFVGESLDEGVIEKGRQGEPSLRGGRGGYLEGAQSGDWHITRLDDMGTVSVV